VGSGQTHRQAAYDAATLRLGGFELLEDFGVDFF
jgi:hypothetical protein